MSALPQILGILNITTDSFSDGGRYLDPAVATEHGLRLTESGADYVDVGAESTNPDAHPVPIAEELRRLEPVVPTLVERGAAVSIDTYKPEVVAQTLEWGATMINDVTACCALDTARHVADSDAKLILMHSTAQRARAERNWADPSTIVSQIVTFFEQRVAQVLGVGVRREQLILDPGLGFFIGANAEASVAVLHGLAALRKLGFPLCLSASRKSFLGVLAAAAGRGREVKQRGPATLAVELWAARQGVEYIRTHDVRALRDGLRVQQALTADAP